MTHSTKRRAVWIAARALSADTRDALTRSGYAFTSSAPWGVAAGILAGGPALSAGPAEPHALAIPDTSVDTLKLYGAQDARGLTGLAAGF